MAAPARPAIAPADLSTLSRLLDEALELDDDRLQAWLEALPSTQHHLRARLRALLAERCSPAHAAFLSEGPRLADPPEPPGAAVQVGDAVGPYRLIREIGHGGMGTVWLAERADGSLKRQIALKLPRLAWGAGLAERMARERDIGVLLEHPHIARLYDAGTDALGRPYLALEYIDGQPLDVWCRAQQLDVRSLLKLFLQVARAVAYAHGRLVVHRDLKPSNVLVTADGQAHLLDFGIAKLLHEVAVNAQADRLTGEQGRLLTLHYASPEQIRGAPVTVASDVYSLGVLLFELLTGCFPFAPPRVSLAALEQSILEDEPALASSQVHDRPTARALRGEVDAILAKALQREPDRRYTTADALADDIERHLAGQPVLARPHSPLYRLRKAVRRHWAGVGAAAIVLMAVFGGGAVAVVQARKATQAAERERVVKEFVADVFRVTAGRRSGSADLRRLPAHTWLEGGAALIESRFKGQPELRADLYGMVGAIFSDMGAHALAAEYAERQFGVLVGLRADAPAQARALLALADATFDSGRVGDAEPHLHRALALAAGDAELSVEAFVLLARIQVRRGSVYEAAATLDSIERQLQEAGRQISTAQAWAYALRAEALVRRNRIDDAYELYARAIAVALGSEGPYSEAATDIRLMAAHWYRQTGDMERVRQLFEPAIAALRERGGAHEIRAAVETARHWWMLYGTRQGVPYEQANATIEQSRAELAAQVVPLPPALSAQVDLWLGDVRMVWGDLAGASKLIEGSEPLLRRTVEPPVERFALIGTAAGMAMHLGRHDEADALFRQRMAIRKSMGRGDHPFAANDYSVIALNLSMAGRFDEAEAFLKTAPQFEPLRVEGWNPQRYTNLLRETLARVRLDRGEPRSALEVLPARALEAQDDTLYSLATSPRVLRGEALCALGQARQGMALLEAQLAALRDGYHAQAPQVAHLRAHIGLCALRTGDRIKARQRAAEAAAAFGMQPELSTYYKQPWRDLQTQLRSGK